MKKIFIEAHKMTREMVNEYKVDYEAQSSLNLSYHLNNKEEKEMKELKGTERQVKWAESIREKMIEGFNYYLNDNHISLERFWKTLIGKTNDLTEEEIKD